ncbi:hypothetical protein P280DRAFT_521848 [Massarina eburnea CBS 473.64]|uniref:VWFA domain-containing protein n=1 Tax=Massarina eburnea CBS 473.64 TaxID=1395130 RepID=A0A6A6RRT4_9PLEO|nr:hypothetical protein P280DRAFT_521848 [Massarina eburnea CBS 473.64]
MAKNGPSDEVYDLLILVDSTYSMCKYLESLKTSLPKIISITQLTDSFAQIGLLAYRDYTETGRDRDGLLEWSGWYDHNKSNTKSRRTQCVSVSDKDAGSNYHLEQEALKKTDSYSGYGPHFVDWVSAANQLHQGSRKAHVFSFLDRNVQRRVLETGYYTYLSTVTQGPRSIAQVTVDILLAWMGAEKIGPELESMPAKLVRYKYGGGIEQIRDEQDIVATLYFWAQNETLGRSPMLLPTGFVEAQYQEKVQERLEKNVSQFDIDASVLKKYLPKRKTPLGDFGQRYARDEKYKKVVVAQLKVIIQTDVTSMSLNTVFGTLWRAVCHDRNKTAREDLVKAFGLYIGKVTHAEERTRMKNWLGGSYDYGAEILDELEKARKKGEKDEDEDDQDDRPITAFRRDELLEIGRSCDGRILHRLGKVLTRITFAESAADLSTHIAATTNAEVPKIPLSIASSKNGSRNNAFKPLFGTAYAAMKFWRDKWNHLEVPETWNSSCLELLIDADSEYRKQM